MCAAIMAAGTVLCLALSAQLIGLFSSSAETIAIGPVALRIICAGFIVSTISVVGLRCAGGPRHGLQSLVISLCRYVVVIMPLAWAFCRVLGAKRHLERLLGDGGHHRRDALGVYHKSVKLK